MAVTNSTLLRMINAINTRLFRSNDSIILTKEEINKAVAPNNFIVGVNIKKITISNTAPLNPEVGDAWINTSLP